MITGSHEQRQLLQRRPKKFFGEEAVTFITDWLNHRETSRQGKPVAQFIAKFNALWNEADQAESVGTGLTKKKRIVSQLQRMLLREAWRFKSDPYFGQMFVDCRRKHETRILWRPAHPSDWSKAKAGTVLSAFFWLVSQGLRERLSRCEECSRWMFAKVCGKKRRQTFCSHACRQAHYAASQEVKDRRADYMKEWRRRPKFSV